MAVIETTETVNGRTFVVHRSDNNRVLQDEAGRVYVEAFDLPNSGHTYTETKFLIDDGDDEQDENELYAQAGRLMLGELGDE